MVRKLNRREMLKYSVATGAMAVGFGGQSNAAQEDGEHRTEFYVSPKGKDSNPGTLEQPFRTLDRARSAVRSLKTTSSGSLPVGGITVWLREGRYELQETFVLGPEDSGEDGRPVTWSAFQEERPVLSGGSLITDWKRVTVPLDGLPVSAQGKVWEAQLPAGEEPGWNPRHLWRNGARLTRARWPNVESEDNDGYKAGDAPFRVVDGYYPAHKDLKDANVVARWREDLKHTWRTVEIYPPDRTVSTYNLPDNLGGGSTEFFTKNDGRWATMRIPIASVQGTKINMEQPLGCISYYWRGMRLMSPIIGGTCHIENALSLLDQPGEWYSDSNRRLIYYMAADGENPNDAQFVASRIDKLVWLRGRKDFPAQFIELKKLRLEHANWHIPEFGYRPVLGCYYGTELTPLVADVPIRSGSVRPTDKYPEYCLQAAVDLMYARHCLLSMCRVSRSGASGIGLAEGCINNRIVGCEVFEAGGHGIHVGLAHGAVCAEDFDWQSPGDLPQNNEIANCYIHDNGHMDWGSYGILSSYTQKTWIHNNLVEQQPYSGIAVSFTFFAFPSGHDYEVTVEHNHVHHVMQKLHDGGGIYTKDGMSENSVIDGNLIHDIGGAHLGIYLDDRSYGPLIKNNMISALIPIYFNHTSKKQFRWGTNYTTDHFPSELKQQAGPEPLYRRFLLGVTRDTA